MSQNNKSKITRRKFMKVSASTIAAPLILPSSLFGKNAPSNRVNLALIGCGGRTEILVDHNFATFDDVRIVAAVDPFKHRRDNMAEKLNKRYGQKVCKPFRNFRDIINRDDIDGIIIATPDHWHVPIALVAAQAGKDMYVEKPLSVAMEWSWRLREICKNSDLIFQYGTQQRSMVSARRAIELVRNNYVGEIKRVDVWSPYLEEELDGDATEKPIPEGFDYDLFTGPSEKKPYTPDRCTGDGSWHCYEHALGFIAGWGVHPLDICQWGLDTDDTSPIHYEGTGVLPSKNALWNTARRWDIHCTYANGIKMHFMDKKTAEPIVRSYHRAFKEDGTTFHGTEGWVSFSRGFCYMVQNGKWESNSLKIKLKDSDKRVYESTNQMRNFVDCMKTRKQTINPLEPAIRVDTISHLADIVIRTGKSLKWNPEQEKMIEAAPEQSKYIDRKMRAPYIF
jgi:predicted dehydrogenase